MKKIDLHIHTKSTVSDSNFEFSMDSMIKFVEVNELDVIAITNHNIFDINQFNEISDKLDCVVLPGVEVDIENGHLLVITDIENLDLFNSQCESLSALIKTENDSIDYDQFTNLFKNYKDYLLIPHTQKDPKISQSTIEKFNENIVCGEVGSNGKWQVTYKNEHLLTPVLFSDIRIKDETKDDHDYYSVRNTYLECNEINISNLKDTLKVRSKVHVNKEKLEGFFEIGDNLLASTGLNIILGKRSSGKTYILERLAKSEWNNVKYIQQFELSAGSKNDKFDEKLNQLYDSMATEYYKEFDTVVKSCIKINNKENNLNINSYIETLVEFAKVESEKNEFAKAALYSSENYSIISIVEVETLIDAVTNIIDAKTEYKEIIEKYLIREQLVKLHNELLINKIGKQKSNIIINETNDVLNNIRLELKKHSNIPQITEFDIIKFAKDILRIKKFNELVEISKKEVTKKVDEEFGFKIIRKREMYTGPTDLNNVYKPRVKFGDAYPLYENPYEYLEKMIEIGVENSSIHKLFFKVTFEAQNQFDKKLSGGERSEFILLDKLKYNELDEVILLDEPESSFDNIFLNENIATKIGELAKTSTVFISTHNPNIAVHLNSNNIIYTTNDDGIFKSYNGEINSSELKGKYGVVSTKTVLLDLMEAGVDAYNKRKEIYKNENI